jgi:predicted Zn-dependent protease
MIGNLKTLTIVRMGTVITYSSLNTIGSKIVDAFGGAISRFELSHHDAPTVTSIDAQLLTMILQMEFGGHTLGITDADLKTNDADEFYNTILGGKNPRNDVAVVSTRRLSPEAIRTESDYHLFISRTLKVSLHEVGHNLGLTDHAAYRYARDGSLCPMSKGEFNKFGFEGYIRAIVDGRGFMFCNECTRFLALAHSDSSQTA